MKPYVDALVREALTRRNRGGALLRAGTMPGFRVEPPRHAAFGDLACDVALVLARELGESPQAHRGARHRPAAGIRTAGWRRSTVGGPGFVNFRFAPAFWRAARLGARRRAAAPGTAGRARPPGAGPRHVVGAATADAGRGRGRAGAIAGAVARLLAAGECDVEPAGAVPASDVCRSFGLAGGTSTGLVAVAAARPSPRSGLARAGAPGAGVQCSRSHPVRLARDGEPVRRAPSLADVVTEIGPDAARFLLLLERPDRPLELDLELAKLARTRQPGLLRPVCARDRLGACAQCRHPPTSTPLDPVSRARRSGRRGAAPSPRGPTWSRSRRERSSRIALRRTPCELAAAVHRWMNRHRMLRRMWRAGPARVRAGGLPATDARDALALCARVGSRQTGCRGGGGWSRGHESGTAAGRSSGADRRVAA